MQRQLVKQMNTAEKMNVWVFSSTQLNRISIYRIQF